MFQDLSMLFLFFITQVIVQISTIIFLKKSGSNKPIISVNTTLTYESVYNEFKLFCMRNLITNILERIMKSKLDHNGKLIAIREITSMSEQFAQGLIIRVVGTMGDCIKDRFYLFHERTEDNFTLLNAVTTILETYSIDLVGRLKVYELEINDINNKNIADRKSSLVDEEEYIYSKFVLSIMGDLNDINKGVDRVYSKS